MVTEKRRARQAGRGRPRPPRPPPAQAAALLTRADLHELAAAFVSLAPVRVLWQLHGDNLPEGVALAELTPTANILAVPWLDYNVRHVRVFGLRNLHASRDPARPSAPLSPSPTHLQCVPTHLTSLRLPPLLRRAPQLLCHASKDVLGHPATRAMLTHGGVHSCYEAAFHGVPVVAAPFMAEAADMAAKLVARGAGVMCRQAPVFRRAEPGMTFSAEHVAGLLREASGARGRGVACRLVLHLTCTGALLCHYCGEGAHASTCPTPIPLTDANST